MTPFHPAVFFVFFKPKVTYYNPDFNTILLLLPWVQKECGMNTSGWTRFLGHNFFLLLLDGFFVWIFFLIYIFFKSFRFFSSFNFLLNLKKRIDILFFICFLDVIFFLMRDHEIYYLLNLFCDYQYRKPSITRPNCCCPASHVPSTPPNEWTGLPWLIAPLYQTRQHRGTNVTVQGHQLDFLGVQIRLPKMYKYF